MNKIIFLLIMCLTFFSCKKEVSLFTLLTNNSTSLWDISFYEELSIGDSVYLHKRTRSISFHSNLDCFTYSKLRTGERTIDIIGPKKNYLGLCSKWKLINDSVIFLNCKDTFIVRIINKDSIDLIDSLGIIKYHLKRVQKPWDIDEESLKRREQEIKTGEYIKVPIQY